MKFVILAALAAVAFAAPHNNHMYPPVAINRDSNAVEFEAANIGFDTSDQIPASDNGINEKRHFVKAERNSLVAPVRSDNGDGSFNVDFEAANNVGDSYESEERSVVKTVHNSHAAPAIEVKLVFVADGFENVANENGIQPQSDILRGVPALIHPIPQFVLDQIPFTAKKRDSRARDGSLRRSSEPEWFVADKKLRPPQGFVSNEKKIPKPGFFADENGIQAQSNFLPVAPEFPHPISQFVLDQIAFAAVEKHGEAAKRKVTP